MFMHLSATYVLRGLRLALGQLMASAQRSRSPRRLLLPIAASPRSRAHAEIEHIASSSCAAADIDTETDSDATALTANRGDSPPRPRPAEAPQALPLVVAASGSEDDAGDGMPDHGDGDPWACAEPVQLPLQASPPDVDLANHGRQSIAVLFSSGPYRNRNPFTSSSGGPALGHLGFLEQGGGALATLYRRASGGGNRGLPPAVYERALSQDVVGFLSGALPPPGRDAVEHAMLLVRRRMGARAVHFLHRYI